MWWAVALALAAVVRPPTVEGARARLYRVHGRSVDEVVDAMNARSTFRDDADRSWHGGARYALRWHWVASRPGYCVATPPRLTVDVVLPRVRTSKALAPAVGRYLEALAAHEGGHVALVHAEAQSLS